MAVKDWWGVEVNPHLGFKCVVFLTVSGLSEGLDVLNVVTVSKDRAFPAAIGGWGWLEVQTYRPGPSANFEAQGAFLWQNGGWLADRLYDLSFLCGCRCESHRTKAESQPGMSGVCVVQV